MPRKKARLQKSDDDSDVSFFNNENQENNGVEIPTILTIFRESEDIHAHDRLITQLKIDFYDKLNINEFSEDFFNCCRFILSIEDRHKSEPFLKFVAKSVIFCLSSSKDNYSKEKSLKLMKRLIKFLTWHHDVQQPVTRFHVVRCIKIFLNEFSDEIEIPDIFYDKIQDALVKRFWDSKSFIRAEAAYASSRLQSPSDADCAIVISLIHLCKFDRSHSVRLAAIQALAITTKTLPIIITRCRDINDLVRKKSYDILQKWKILKPLTVSKRIQIMETGLTDKSEIVKNSCTQLLRMWLEASNNDPVSLLKRLDVENMEDSTEMILKTLLSSMSSTEISTMVDFIAQKMDEKHLVKENHLDSETAFFWKNLVQFLSEKPADDSELLEKIIPTIPDFEIYLRNLFYKTMEQFAENRVNVEECVESYTIIKHLLPLVKNMAIFDEHSRLIMINMIKWALSSPNITCNYVEHLMKLLVHLESNNEKICNLIVELINELLYSDIDLKSDGSYNTIHSTLSSVHNSHHETIIHPPTTVIETNEIEDPAIVNREAIRKNRLEIAEVEVRINELNESINNCMQTKSFDKIENLVSDLKLMTEKKTNLQNQNEVLLAPINNKMVTEDIGPIQENEESLILEEKVKAELKENQSWMAVGMENKIIKANVMISSMIQECNLLWTLPPSLRTLFENVILLSVQHSDLSVRQKAILSMGLCCLLDKNLAIQYYKVFIQSLLIDHESVKEISLRSLVDMFIRFGIEAFQDEMISQKDQLKMIKTQKEFEISESLDKIESSSECTPMTEENYNKCTSELMSPIIDLLNSKNSEIQSTVAIGLSKLIYNQKLISSKLLSRLLLLWFSPITEDNLKLRQYLGTFFSNFSLMSAENQEAITNSFLITMRTLIKAPAKSPLLEIDFNNVIDFFERVTDSKYLIENRGKSEGQLSSDNPCHDNLAIILSNQILNSPLATEIKYYIPMLIRLRLSPNNIELLKVLEPMIMTMIKKVKDKKLVLLLEKFYKSLRKRLDETAVEASDMGNEILANETLNESDVQIPISRPSLLELGSDGKKMNKTYLCGRAPNDMTRIDDTISSEISSIHLNEDMRKIVTTPNYKSGNSFNRNVDIDSDVPSSTINTPDDEKIFKKPMNIRITRSRARSQLSDNTSISSINSNVTTSTRIPRNSSTRKK